MIKFITGEKGSGKTKWLIDSANEEYKAGNGNIAFVDVDDDHIFSLDYNVRLINVTEYGVKSIASLYGFVCGMMAMDYDLEKIYIDSIYKIVDLRDDQVLIRVFEDLNKVLEERNTKLFINIDRTKDQMPEKLKEYSEDASL